MSHGGHPRRPSSRRIKRWHSAPSAECRIRTHTVRTMVGLWSYATLVVLLSTLAVGITAESGHERQKRSPSGYGQPSYQPKKPSSMSSQSLTIITVADWQIYREGGAEKMFRLIPHRKSIESTWLGPIPKVDRPLVKLEWAPSLPRRARIFPQFSDNLWPF